MTLAIDLRHVSVRYGSQMVLHDLSLQVAPGEIVGFLGPNGAGKTTALRVLFGLTRPVDATSVVRVFGADMLDSATNPIRQRIGFVPDPDGLDSRVSAQQLLTELAALSGVAAVDRAAVCAALDLRPSDLRRRIGALSRGTRQKVALVQGLQHRPDLLVLDEPSEGLDPLAKNALNNLLLAMSQRGGAVLFSSHVLSEVEAICDRVAMIRAGRLVAVQTLSDLRRHLPQRVRLLLADNVAPTLPNLPLTQTADGAWEFGWSGSVPDLLHLLHDLPLLDLTITPPTLADVFAGFYEAPDA